jgi:transcriptional regulator with XRE-family HTH domain
MAGTSLDPIMENVRSRFAKSGLTRDALGTRMGYPADAARKSAWQFIHRTSDPRLSMFRRFAEAVGVPLKSLL